MQRELERVITQYKKGDINNFEKVCEQMPMANLKSHRKEDVLASLYIATSLMSSPFTIHEQNKELVKGFPLLYQCLHNKHKDNVISFVDEIINNQFLKNLHFDCLGLYPRLVELDLPLRPAFFYDYIEVDKYRPVPARVSTAYFDTCNNYYKDLAEVFARQLTLLAGLNNLLKRGDHNEFEATLKVNKRGESRKELLSLDNFADVDLGQKIQYIDDCFYTINMQAIDSRLRNGIAHYKYEYKESTQVITYYPAKEGMERIKSEQITFMEFLRKTLLLFREVHSLNHLIKATLYYTVLILNKDV